jgi:hypothetical protein
VRSGDQKEICQGTQVRGVDLHLAISNRVWEERISNVTQYLDM